MYRSDLPGGPYALIGNTPAGVPLYDDNTAVIGHTYYFIVRAVAATGLETCQSNEAEGEARCAPPVAAVNIYGGNRGYYMLNATSDCGPASQLKIYVADADSSFVAGPYPDGKTLRLLRSKDGKTSTGSGFGPASITITVRGRQALVYAVDPAGQVGQSVPCTSR